MPCVVYEVFLVITLHCSANFSPKMRFRFKLKIKDIELDMTPMIDVVFLLIVFFTLAINFTAADQNERIKLPVSELAQPPEASPAKPVTLHILPNGRIIYDETDRALHELQAPLNFHLRVLHNMDVPTESVTVIIRADAQCESGHVLDVVELCQRLGLERFVLRARQQEE